MKQSRGSGRVGLRQRKERAIADKGEPTVFMIRFIGQTCHRKEENKSEILLMCAQDIVSVICSEKKHQNVVGVMKFEYEI